MKEPHRCHYDKCRISKKTVHLLDHQCYIQCVKPEDFKEKKTKKLLEYHRGINPNASIYVDPPVFVCADFEAMLSPDKIHLPILVCAATSLSDTIYSFYGSDCTADFLAFLTLLTVNEYGENRDVICIFHNLKGYDSVFLQHQLKREGRHMEDMVKMGTKVLSFVVGPNKASLHITVMFCLATMDTDGKESTTENPYVLKEHVFVISDDPLQDFNSVHHAQWLIGKHLTQDLKVTVNRLRN